MGKTKSICIMGKTKSITPILREMRQSTRNKSLISKAMSAIHRKQLPNSYGPLKKPTTMRTINHPRQQPMTSMATTTSETTRGGDDDEERTITNNPTSTMDSADESIINPTPDSSLASDNDDDDDRINHDVDVLDAFTHKIMSNNDLFKEFLEFTEKNSERGKLDSYDVSKINVIEKLERLYQFIDPINGTEFILYDKPLQESMPNCNKNQLTKLIYDYYYNVISQMDFSDTTNDYKVFAFFSAIFVWPSQLLLSLFENSDIIQTFIEERSKSSVVIYNHRVFKNIFCIKYIFKIISRAVNKNIAKSVPMFNIYNELNIDVAFLEYMYKQYCESGIFPIKLFCNDRVRGLDILKKNIVVDDVYEPTIKYITGHACVGKSSFVLKGLRDNGWEIASRNNVGSFSSKEDNPAAVAGLYMALNNVLKHPYVIGDRGHIDNAIWVFIMQYCNPDSQKFLIEHFFDFINSSFNLASLYEFSKHKVTVIIDPNSLANKSRMLARAQNGDLNRARIKYYTQVQGICYALMARICNWQIFYVPYIKNTQTIDNKLYASITKYITSYYGKPSESPKKDNEHLQLCKKTINGFANTSDFAKSVGIFK